MILVGMRTEAIGAGAGGEPTVTEGGSSRTRSFWVPLVWAVVPTLLVTSFTCFFLTSYYEPPKFLVGVLFIGLVIPAAVICEKLGFGQFSILGGSTVPDWLLFSVMMVLVYLYSLVLVIAGRGVVRLALQARRTVRGDWWKTGWVR
jgi:magnesium-transporting ATPase (P-type)